MTFLMVSVAILTLAGALLPMTAKRESVEFGASPPNTGVPYLVTFGLIVIAFGAFTTKYYWEEIFVNANDVIFVIGLCLAMIGGMFVQVLAANHRARRPLFSVSRDDLLFPLLFSIIVFYPIWAVTATAPKGFLSIHAAFLNGYFWESVVSAAKRKK
jgi:hypothetical protein